MTEGEPVSKGRTNSFSSGVSKLVLLPGGSKGLVSGISCLDSSPGSWEGAHPELSMGKAVLLSTPGAWGCAQTALASVGTNVE